MYLLYGLTGVKQFIFIISALNAEISMIYNSSKQTSNIQTELKKSPAKN